VLQSNGGGILFNKIKEYVKGIPKEKNELDINEIDISHNLMNKSEKNNRTDFNNFNLHEYNQKNEKTINKRNGKKYFLNKIKMKLSLIIKKL